MKNTPNRLADASTHAKACKKIGQNVRYGNPNGTRTSHSWSFDSKKSRGGKLFAAFPYKGGVCAFTRSQNGCITVHSTDAVETQTDAIEALAAIIQYLAPITKKKGNRTRVGKKHAARRLARYRREAAETRERLGLKAGESILHPELND